MHNDTQRQKTIRGLVARAIIAAVMLVTALAIKPVLLGSSAVVTLPDAPPLTGQVSQAFTSGGGGELPQPYRDYVLEKVTYFENDEWVVVHIVPKSNAVTDGIVALKKHSGIYEVVLGPGSAFPSTQVSALPDDVSLYLRDLGAVYEPL